MTDKGLDEEKLDTHLDVGVPKGEGEPIEELTSRDPCAQCDEPLSNRWNYCPRCGHNKDATVPEMYVLVGATLGCAFGVAIGLPWWAVFGAVIGAVVGYRMMPEG